MHADDLMFTLSLFPGLSRALEYVDVGERHGHVRQRPGDPRYRADTFGRATHVMLEGCGTFSHRAIRTYKQTSYRVSGTVLTVIATTRAVWSASKMIEFPFCPVMTHKS